MTSYTYIKKSHANSAKQSNTRGSDISLSEDPDVVVQAIAEAASVQRPCIPGLNAPARMQYTIQNIRSETQALVG